MATLFICLSAKVKKRISNNGNQGSSVLPEKEDG